MSEIPAIIDIEASGFGQGSYPIEIGVALANRETFNFLVRPAAHWTHWSEEAEGIHGISRERLQKEGKSPREIALILNEMLRGQTLYSDAWGFDSSWLGKLFDEAGLVQRFRMESINKLLNEEQMEAWSHTKDEIWQERGTRTRHRAASDVLVLQETFLRVTSHTA